MCRLIYDIKTVRKKDPACRSWLEVVLLYSGFHALLWHRAAHAFHRLHLRFLARMISQICRFFTGIEIHPAAKIGRGLFIDHGSGIVIGETAEIGDDCTLYQSVTIGGTGKESGKRHPTLGNDVLVGAGAAILGPVSVGDHAKIAAGAVVLSNVPEGGTAVGVPARVVRIGEQRVAERDNADLDQVNIPDPVSQELCRLRAGLERMQARIDELERERTAG
ncbi:MAG: serine O-acetyltransferase [Clostridia bacterium]|nr:serine O-acetyltransferase [Clostridia bacterium]